jgi:hypothetical protein
MNERIRELALQAGFKTETWRDLAGVPTTSIYKEALGGNNLEKFAELIVRECADIVADAVDHREPASTYVDKIKQHFGVEE